MSKRKPIGVKHHCYNCSRSTFHSKCPYCGKPLVPVKDLHAKIVQELLEFTDLPAEQQQMLDRIKDMQETLE